MNNFVTRSYILLQINNKGSMLSNYIRYLKKKQSQLVNTIERIFKVFLR